MNRKLNLILIALGFLTNGVYAQDICDFYLDKVIFLYKIVDYEHIGLGNSEFLSQEHKKFHATEQNPTIRCDLNLVRNKYDNFINPPYIPPSKIDYIYSDLLNKINDYEISKIIVYPYKGELEFLENNGTKGKIAFDNNSKSILDKASKNSVDIEINNSVKKNLNENLPICKTTWNKGNLIYNSFVQNIDSRTNADAIFIKFFKFNDKQGNQITLDGNEFVYGTQWNTIKDYENPVQQKCNTKQIGYFENCKDGICKKQVSYIYDRSYNEYSTNNKDYNKIAIFKNTYFIFNKKKINTKGYF